MAVVYSDNGRPAAAAEALDRAQGHAAVLRRLADVDLELALERLDDALCAGEGARDVRAHLDEVTPDRLGMEHVVEGRDGEAVGRRHVERVGDLAERLLREPAAVALLRQAQRRDDGRARLRIGLLDLLDLVVERRRHRSTSPMTGSSDAATATRSATAVSRTQVAVAWSAAKLGARNFTRHGLGTAVGDEEAPALAARRLDRDVDLPLGHEIALGDDLEVVDEGLHRGVELLARREHDLAVVGDPGLAAHLLEPRHALADDARRGAHLVHVHLVAVVDVAVRVDGDVEVDLVVGEVRHRPPQVPVDSGGAQHRARLAERERVLGRQEFRSPSSARARSCCGRAAPRSRRRRAACAARGRAPARRTPPGGPRPARRPGSSACACGRP